MYSMVLMMALSGGGDVPAWHGCRGGNGCYGGCHGCWGGGQGCWGNGHGCRGGGHGCFGGGHGCFGGGHGCFGGGHKLFGRRHGCNGCWGGGHGCWGNGHGCHGYAYGHGCHGGCWGGYGHGCHGGCWGGGYHAAPAGGVAPTGAPPATQPREQAPAPKTGSLAAPATIVVSLPADAKLTIDDTPTMATSATRVFASPVLEPGKEYVYTLKAEMDQDGKTVSTSKRVSVRAGQETRVTLDFVESVASR